jgi:hypothetical protein
VEDNVGTELHFGPDNSKFGGKGQPTSFQDGFVRGRFAHCPAKATQRIGVKRSKSGDYLGFSSQRTTSEKIPIALYDITLPFNFNLFLAKYKAKNQLFMEYVGFSIFHTQEVLVRTPQVLTLSVDYHLKPKLSFFHQELQMPKESIQLLIQKHPNIFATLSLEKNIRPKLIGLFSRRLLFEPVHLSKMLNLYPQILDRS